MEKVESKAGGVDPIRNAEEPSRKTKKNRISRQKRRQEKEFVPIPTTNCDGVLSSIRMRLKFPSIWTWRKLKTGEGYECHGHWIFSSDGQSNRDMEGYGAGSTVEDAYNALVRGIVLDFFQKQNRIFLANGWDTAVTLVNQDRLRVHEQGLKNKMETKRRRREREHSRGWEWLKQKNRTGRLRSRQKN